MTTLYVLWALAAIVVAAGVVASAFDSWHDREAARHARRNEEAKP